MRKLLFKQIIEICSRRPEFFFSFPGSVSHPEWAAKFCRWYEVAVFWLENITIREDWNDLPHRLVPEFIHVGWNFIISFVSSTKVWATARNAANSCQPNSGEPIENVKFVPPRPSEEALIANGNKVDSVSSWHVRLLTWVVTQQLYGLSRRALKQLCLCDHPQKSSSRAR